MPKATWNGVVLAESDRCEPVEGNYYFPPDSIHREHFRPSDGMTDRDGAAPEELEEIEAA